MISGTFRAACPSRNQEHSPPYCPDTSYHWQPCAPEEDEWGRHHTSAAPPMRLVKEGCSEPLDKQKAGAMEYETKVYALLWASIIGLILKLAVLVGIGWGIWHFVVKYW